MSYSVFDPTSYDVGIAPLQQEQQPDDLQQQPDQQDRNGVPPGRHTEPVAAVGSIPPADEEDDDEYAAIAEKPRINAKAVKRYYKILVVGESGLGKTTFIHNLFLPYAQGKLALHDGRSTKLEDFEKDPSSMCTRLDPIPINDHLDLHISIQDTPGYGDDMNLVGYLRRVVEHIQAQRQKDFIDKEKAIDALDEGGCLKHSVTICLYFLPPHRTKRIDHILLAALSKVVPTLPVIAKADSMVSDELEEYRKELQLRFSGGGGSTDEIRPDVYQFAAEHLKHLGVLEPSAVTPFAVIGSTKAEPIEVDGKQMYKLEREYKWGVANAVNRKHSDTIVLKRLLMGDKVDSFWHLLDRSLQDYKVVARQLKAGKSLQELVEDACAPAQSILEKAQHENQKNIALHRDMEELRAELERSKAAAQSILETAQHEIQKNEALHMDLEELRAELERSKTEVVKLKSKLSTKEAELRASAERLQQLQADPKKGGIFAKFKPKPS